jgi:hypothetical protein
MPGLLNIDRRGIKYMMYSIKIKKITVPFEKQ